jgi:hypothetical protein
MPSIMFIAVARKAGSSAITEHARTACHGKATLFTAHALKPCSMFGASVSMRHANGRDVHAQSGCLSASSQPTNQRRQSATCHRQVVACPSAGNRHHAPRHLFACHRQVGRASFGARRTEVAVRRLASIRQNLWKLMQASAVMQRPNINSHQQAPVSSPVLSSINRLTRRCSRRSVTGSLRQCLVGAAELGR